MNHNEGMGKGKGEPIKGTSLRIWGPIPLGKRLGNDVLHQNYPVGSSGSWSIYPAPLIPQGDINLPRRH